MEDIFSYWKIVFGLKHHRKLYECCKFTELLRSLRVIISEHDGTLDYCERPGLHYHGIIELETDKNVDSDDVIMLLKTQCAYFKIERCDFPEQFVVNLTGPDKKLMIIEIAKSANLITYYSNIPAIGFGIGYFEEKKPDFNLIIETIIARRVFEPDELCKQMEKDWINSNPNELERYFTDAIAVARQKILNESILDLCCRYERELENYYTPSKSADLVLEWCQYQNIDVIEFTYNLVRCLDRQVRYKNSLLFQGPYESGVVSIINSITEACILIGEVVHETTGYTYVWEECVEKRCIVMRDIFVEKHMIEELEKILSGTGTCVPHREGFPKYLCPTPVIVIYTEDSESSYLQHVQSSFLGSYINLKPFVKLSSDRRQLHPYWLSILYYHIIGNDVPVTISEDSCMSSNDSEILVNGMDCELGNGLSSPAAFVSSPASLSGSPNHDVDSSTSRSSD